jgi:hypothetical protein
MKSLRSYFNTAATAFREAMRDFDRSVLELNRHLDAVAADLDQDLKAVTGVSVGCWPPAANNDPKANRKHGKSNKPFKFGRDHRAID